ncbi:hypothetical protein G4B88_006939 [Cannabis sativa]|uniref:Uncharacterized protein n=1 Tax=Cannabis sativa TaxID=3483 RepID=A0A7J6DJ09_CANSA|nr:hypothetical protein G4B88_002691 [Cannabis sativa]KAF4377659.1 hypothetical protein G4B88_006939 [Cannabis sativa]
MEQNEESWSRSSCSALAILPRLDRLDRLVKLLDEKSRVIRGGGCCNINISDQTQNHIKKTTLWCALDEVVHKGSVMDRLLMLEKRLLKLWVEVEIKVNEMEQGNNSNSTTTEINETDKKKKKSKRRRIQDYNRHLGLRKWFPFSKGF